jgi:hypothetical protein
MPLLFEMARLAIARRQAPDLVELRRLRDVIADAPATGRNASPRLATSSSCCPT